jgi:hypothetical protein
VVLSSAALEVQQLRFTGFYGEPWRELRKESWYLLRFLRAQSAMPWLCAGDFNEVLVGEEHFGANGREQWQMTAFQEAVADCELVDLGFSGLPYTWDNKQQGDHNVKARLDRAFGNGNLLNVLGDSSVRHIQMVKSDHCALLVELRSSIGPDLRRTGRPKRPFRCEDMWFRHEGFKDMVKQSWDLGSGTRDLSTITASLKSMQGQLRRWGKMSLVLLRNRSTD